MERAHAVCYRVQERVRTLWATLPEKAKDYIAKPKANGYVSRQKLFLSFSFVSLGLPKIFPIPYEPKRLS